MKKLLLAFALTLPAPAIAQTVSAADERATAAGIAVLKQGGTAADAAIAMMLALNVVEPGASGIGGGGFLVYHDAKTGKISTYNARETAPKAADERWFIGPDGKALTYGQAVPGGRSVGVPGVLRLMEAAHGAHGRLKWAALFQPAIELAANGWKITPRFYNAIRNPRENFFSPWAKAYLYTADGTAKPAGTLLKNPEQADLFGKIAAQGPNYFYTGAPAQAIVDTVNGAARNPSKMTLADFADFKAQARDPSCITYRRHRICGMLPPSSGGVTVFQILKQLERFDMGKLGKDSPVAWHLFAESSRLAYADRDAYVGDPDFVTVPVAGLLAPDYLAKRSALISETSTMATVAPGVPAGAPPRTRGTMQPEHGTTSLTATDRWGNVAEATVTIESPFGSGLTAHGIFLNNELTDFDLAPELDGYLRANRVQGGKRPRSSMSPTIVYGPDGKVRLAVGAAGGNTIIAQVTKAIIGVIDWKMSAQDAIAMGLIFAPRVGGVAEQGTELEAMLPRLRALGETLTVAPLGLKANAVERVGGVWVGAADPRSEGVSMDITGRIVRPKAAAAIARPSE